MEAEIDALFAEWNTPESAGCGVGVNRHGSTVFERGYGMSHLERKVPIAPDTIFFSWSALLRVAATSSLLSA